MGKLSTLFILTLLLVYTSSIAAARSGPAFSNESPAKTQANQETVETEQSSDTIEDSCEGVEEDECLMRRTLAAHVDYIYTQNKKP